MKFLSIILCSIQLLHVIECDDADVKMLDKLGSDRTDFKDMTIYKNIIYIGAETTFNQYNIETKKGKQNVYRSSLGYHRLQRFQDIIYIGTYGPHILYAYDPKTSDYNPPIIGSDKEIPNPDATRGMTILKNKIYYTTNHIVFEYNPEWKVNRKLLFNETDTLGDLIPHDNKLYISRNRQNLAQFNPRTGEYRVLTGGPEGAVDNQKVLIKLAIFNDKIYFGTRVTGQLGLCEFDTITEKYNMVFHGYSGSLIEGVAAYNGRILFSDQGDNIREYNPTTGESQVYSKKVTNDVMIKLLPYKDTLYGLTFRGELFSYFRKMTLEEAISKNRLRIVKSSKKAILNELQYMNPSLKISQLEVEKMSSKSATIKAKSDSKFYSGSIKVYLTPDIKVISIYDLIEKAIFLENRGSDLDSNVKDIILYNRTLNFDSVIASVDGKPSSKGEQKGICFVSTPLSNSQDTQQTSKTPNCKFTRETTIVTTITKGLSKETSESSTTERSHNWSFEYGVTISGEAGLWPFGKTELEVSTNYGAGGTYGSSESITLSSTVDTSDEKEDSFKETSTTELPSQEVVMAPNSKAKVTATMLEITAHAKIIIRQNITGDIKTDVVGFNDVTQTSTFSIRQLMDILNENDVLPPEVTLNADGGITFVGKAERTMKQGYESFIEYEMVA